MRIVDIWDSILAKFGIKTSFTSDEIRNKDSQYTKEYQDISETNFTAIISNKLAVIAMTDSDLYITEDNKRAELINSMGQNIWGKLEKIIAMSLGTGGALIVPYIQNGKIFFDIVSQDRLCINKMGGNDIVSATVLADMIVINNNKYYRFTNYDIVNNNLYISNKITTEYGRTTDVEAWANIEDITIANVERVPFGFIKCPVDNRKCSDDYGVPITYGCKKIIDEIKECLAQIVDEYEFKEVKIVADSRVFKRDKNGKPILDSRLYQAMEGETPNKLFEIFDPAIRESSYYTRLTKLFEQLEKAVGLSRGVLTDPNATYENTQKIREAIGDTWAVISKIRKSAEKGINEFLYACDVLANRYGLTPQGEFAITYDWDTSMLESTTEKWQQLKDGQSMGIISKAECRAWQTGETIEEAQEKIDEIALKEPSLNSLIGLEEGSTPPKEK